ncbi:hypothetical protein CEXT_809191 [Caerostris extrusa]|uniref:Uncharacterized protein n=1 Tax=Caerostris extrusa TaxID=172846 RepID=A0AAV4MQL5_CAEEX|nr:hypothetical protein CEXT_809191 [Caerostris extrusa]
MAMHPLYTLCMNDEDLKLILQCIMPSIPSYYSKSATFGIPESDSTYVCICSIGERSGEHAGQKEFQQHLGSWEICDAFGDLCPCRKVVRV